MKTNAKSDVRKTMEAKLERLRPIAVELEKLPALKEATAKAAGERREWLDLLADPRRTSDAGDRNKSSAMERAVIQASQIVRDIEGPGREAQREIRRIEALLNAPAEVERLKKERVAVAADGPAIERRALALRDVVEAIRNQRDQAEAKATAERTEAADRAIEARLEGKPVPPTKAGGATTADLAKLDAELAAAQRQLAAATEKLGALSQRAKELRGQLLQAMSLVADLDAMQAFEDIRPVREYRAAINRVAGTMHPDSAGTLDEVAVQAMINELGAEYRDGWQPAELTTAPIPADASTDESADPGAHAAV